MRATAFVTLGLALLTANVRFAAAADTFAVSPVRISIPSGDRSEAVTVTNGSDGPVRFQVTGFAWAQRPDGATELTPSEDLIIFPTLATVAAHQSQVIRIGVVGASSDTERTFRIFLRQLPEPNTAQNPARASITIRTRYSIPVFLEPPRPASHLTVSGATVKHQSLSFSVKNDGNAHALLRTVDVTGFDAGGAVLFTSQLDGVYVLAHDRLDAVVDIPAAKCASVRSVRLAVTGDSSATWTLAAETSECS